MTTEQKQLLEKQLWGVANVLRGKMNADEYKNYILGFIFYKYLSERLEIYANEKLLTREKFKFAEIKENTKEGKATLEAIKKACIGHLGFFLKPTELFSYLVEKGKGNIKNQANFIIEDLKNVLNTIEKTSMGTASEDDFKGLFDDVDLTSTKLGSRENQKNEVIVDVLSHLSGIDFKLEDSKSDLLGDAYEYLIGEFAAGARKKGGEFYTPAQVSRLLAQIVSQDKKRIKSVYDPTCGSGSLLLRVGDYTEVASYFGQELNPTTYNLARMNMILHGIHFDKFKIFQGDTLREDMFPDLKAEAIIANPPFSAEWKGDSDPQLAHDDRFSQYGRLAPKSAADYAFVTHMLHHLSDNGTMGIVLPHGVLYRPDAEEQIRRYIIEKQNYLDAIIGLPPNLFYGTTYSTVILIFKKCRKDNDDIIIIDASKEFEKGQNQNMLSDDNIRKIFNTYKERSETEKYSHRASLEEIKRNGFNLNIPRYIDIFDEEEIINIEREAIELASLQKKERELTQKLASFCKELGIRYPFEKDGIKKVFSRDVRFKDEKGHPYPDWAKIKLSDVYDFISTNSYSKDKLNYDKGSVKNIHYGDIHTKLKTSFNAKDELVPYINEDIDLSRISPESFLVEGDLVIADASEDYNDIGKAIEIIALDGQRILAGLHTIIARPKTNKLERGFMSVYVRSFLYKSQIRIIAQGTKVLGLPKKYLKDVVLYIPTKPEQLKIYNFFSSMNNSLDELIKIKQEQVAKTKNWEKGLMQNLFK